MTPLLEHFVHFQPSVRGQVVGHTVVGPPQEMHSPFLVGRSNGSTDCDDMLPPVLLLVVRAWLAPASYAAGFLLCELSVKVGVLLVRQ
jgi:hypothetical protein